MNHKQKAIELLGKEIRFHENHCPALGFKSDLVCNCGKDRTNQMHSKAVEVVEGLLERIEGLEKRFKEYGGQEIFKQLKELQSAKKKIEELEKMLKMKQDDWLEVCKENDELQSYKEAVESAEGELPEKEDCNNCQYISVTEELQKYSTIEPHICKLLNQRVLHVDRHPVLKPLSNCPINQAIDIATPILAKAKLRIEELEEIVRRLNVILNFKNRKG